MMDRISLLICLISATVSTTAHSAVNIKYPASEIPAELKDNANVVIRKYDLTYTIIDKGHAKVTEHTVITILNKSADKRALFSENYSKLYKMGNYWMLVFDGSGNQIKKVKQSEFKDLSAVPDVSLYSDDRVITYMPMINSYPYTVEYLAEHDDYNLMGYISWIPQNDFDASVENASLKLIVPKGFAFRYRSKNLTDSLTVTQTATSSEYLWKTENLKAIDYEPYSKGIEEVVPNVLLAPSDFQVERYQGNFDSWQSYGKFVSDLIQMTNTLSDKTTKEINEIVKNISDEKQKVKLLYEYFQSKTRYINVKLGIGGWKPFDASVVDELGYGDCKALSNYMKTILDTAGIASYYSLIMAGTHESDMDTCFPHVQFNHAFLFVPLRNDTVWLECTDQKNPFNYLGSFTANRYALVITRNGGKLVQTPVLKAEDNMLVRKAEVTIDDQGNGTATITTKFTGIQFDDRVPYYYSNPDDQKKELTDDIDIPNFRVDKWKYQMEKEGTPVIIENLQLQIENYSSASGKRIFLPLNLMNKVHNVPVSLKSRKTSVLLNWSFIDIDTIVYNLPGNLEAEFMPEIKEIKSEFGNYNAIVLTEGNKIVYIRTFKHNSGQYPASKYNDYIDFRKKILIADNVKIALIRKDSD